MKSVLAVMMLVLAMATSTVDAGLTYPKCPEAAAASGDCCAFGKDKMAHRGYIVAALDEGETIVTCSHGKLACFRGNPNLRATSDERPSVECPDFTPYLESRSGLEVLDGVEAKPADDSNVAPVKVKAFES